MERFMRGIAGMGLGLFAFMPSYLHAQQTVTEGSLMSIPLTVRMPLLLGMALMYGAPLLFWVLIPFKEWLTGKSEDVGKLE